MSKAVVQGQFYAAGSVAKVDGTFNPLLIEVPEDGYVFEDPKNKNQRTFMPKADFEARYQLALPETKPQAPAWDGVKLRVEATFYKAGDAAKIDGTFMPLLIDVPEDGYVFKDPKNKGQRTFLPKAEFEASYESAAPKPALKAKSTTPAP